MAKKFTAVMAEMMNDPQTRSEIEREKRRASREIAIYQVRERLGLTQKEFAEILGVSQARVAQYEQSDDLKLSTLQKIADCVDGELVVQVRLPEGEQIDLLPAFSAAD